MKTLLYFIIIFLCISKLGLSQNIESCNRAVNSSDLSKKMPKNICIPKGYKIFNVIDSVDLNDDNLKDVVLGWAKLPLGEGDTIYYGIYLQKKDSSFVLKKILNNLQSIYMTAFSKGKNATLDSLRKLYTGDTEVIFSRNSILIKFPITWESFGKNYVFTYDKKRNNWFLNKIQYWVGNVDYSEIRKYKWNEKRHFENLLDEKVQKNGIPIDDFNLTKVMIVEGEEDWFYFQARKKFEWFD